MQALTGVVDQDVDAPEGVAGGGDQALQRARRGDVGRDGQRAGQLAGQLVQAVRTPGGQHDPCAGVREPARGRGPDAGRRAGDDADGVGDLHDPTLAVTAHRVSNSP